MLETRRLIAIGAAAFVLSVAVTILILGTSGRRARTLPAETPVTQAPTMLAPSDFVLPAQSLSEAANAFVPFRDRLDKWEDDQVQRYWVDVRDIVRQLLEEESDRAIEALLGTVD